jgi:carbon-monoxide dehydrogenase medium subunit
MEFARRHGDFAIAGLATQARREDVRLVDLRLVLFGIGDRPIRARSAEQALLREGRTGAIAAARAAITEGLAPMSDIHASAETRLQYARVLLERTARQLGAT